MLKTETACKSCYAVPADRLREPPPIEAVSHEVVPQALNPEGPQIGTVSEEGVSISAPFYLDDKWDHEGYHLAEYGSIHEEPGEGMPQQTDPRIWQAMQEETVEIFCPWHSDDDLSESE